MFLSNFGGKKILPTLTQKRKRERETKREREREKFHGPVNK